MNTTTEYKINLKQKILDAAFRLFTRKGIRAVKMDDIAASLSISKRTLYEIFTDKESLVYYGVKYYNDHFNEIMIKYADAPDHNPIDTIMHFYHLQIEYNRQVMPVFYEDVRKYNKVCKLINDLKEERARKGVDFFEKGVKQGFFREDIDYALALQIAQASMAGFHDTKNIKRYKLEDIFRSFVFVFLRGLCTEKGLQCLDRQLELLKK
ncbi:MAG: TetR/AcrR family transcriptional regulator [Prevotellaceae bacterium]|nr:TetR/AcrR family transcriptional regulator [Prevotellaceae bacterium]